jgi:hypothetical protein
MAWSRPHCLPIQLSPFTHTSLEAFSLQPYMPALCAVFTGGCHKHRSRFARASPFARRLAADRYRIEFTCIWDCSFAPGCFPPSLAATQLPFASPPVPGSVAIRFSLIGLYVVMITRARRRSQELILATNHNYIAPETRTWNRLAQLIRQRQNPELFS